MEEEKSFPDSEELYKKQRVEEGRGITRNSVRSS